MWGQIVGATEWMHEIVGLMTHITGGIGCGSISVCDSVAEGMAGSVAVQVTLAVTIAMWS